MSEETDFGLRISGRRACRIHEAGYFGLGLNFFSTAFPGNLNWTEKSEKSPDGQASPRGSWLRSRLIGQGMGLAAKPPAENFEIRNFYGNISEMIDSSNRLALSPALPELSRGRAFQLSDRVKFTLYVSSVSLLCAPILQCSGFTRGKPPRSGDRNSK